LASPPVCQMSSDERCSFSIPLALKEEVDASPSHQHTFALDEVQIIGLYRHYALVDAKSLCQEASGIAWIDLCAAQSRLQFEIMMDDAKTAALDVQGLLVPLTFKFAKAEAEVIKEDLRIIQKWGIQIREIGQEAFLVDAIPSFLREEEVGMILEEVIDERREAQSKKDFSHREHCLAACLNRQMRARKKSYTMAEAKVLIKELLHDIETAPVDARMKPILCYARKLTLTPASMTEADASAIYDAGWQDDAFYSTVLVVALFNFYNRLVEGVGLTLPDGHVPEAAKRLSTKGYDMFAQMMRE